MFYPSPEPSFLPMIYDSTIIERDLLILEKWLYSELKLYVLIITDGRQRTDAYNILIP